VVHSSSSSNQRAHRHADDRFERRVLDNIASSQRIAGKADKRMRTKSDVICEGSHLSNERHVESKNHNFIHLSFFVLGCASAHLLRESKETTIRDNGILAKQRSHPEN
jgi:hypothetical protein